MHEQENTRLDLEIDEPINSIQDVISNDNFQTTILRIKVLFQFIVMKSKIEKRIRLFNYPRG
jgi:hypothetical protein